MDEIQRTDMNDIAAAEAKLREYFDRFGEKEVEGIIEHVYATPINIGLKSGERVQFMNADDVREGLALLREQLEAFPNHVKWQACMLKKFNKHRL
jgi:hypothetical protein